MELKERMRLDKLGVEFTVRGMFSPAEDEIRERSESDRKWYESANLYTALVHRGGIFGTANQAEHTYGADIAFGTQADIPEPEEVLGDLLDLARDHETYDTFEDYCLAYGLNADSRRNERIYELGLLEASAFRSFLLKGSFTLHEWLWETEYEF